MAAAAAAKSLQSCPSLCDPIDGSPPGSPIPGILQARTLEYGHMQQPLSQKVSLQNFPVTVFIVIGFGNSCIIFSGSQLMKVVVPFSQKLTEKSRLWLTCVKARWLKQGRGCFLSHNLKSDRGTGDPRLLWRLHHVMRP